MNEYNDVTGEPLIPPPGYLVIKPLSPAILRIVGDTTIGSVMEGVMYNGGGHHHLLVREPEDTTGYPAEC